MKSLFDYFERRLDAYPDSPMPTPEKGKLLAFLWACTEGARTWIFVRVLLSVLLGVFGSLLFAWVGDVVDWLTTYTPDTLWAEKGSLITLILGLCVLSIFGEFFGNLVRFQVLQGVLPMRLRWWFHKHMLGQSMQFYHDEFSGRVSAKVMQTALAVRDTIMTVAEMVSFVSAYLITSGVILLGLDFWLFLPFIGWLVAVAAIMRFFLPRLRETASNQADARALMTGRVTDAYANIGAVKLFSHSNRELNYAKSAMREFMHTVHAQMRWVSVLNTTTESLSLLMIVGSTAIGVYLWSIGQVTVGAIAVASGIALRLKGMVQWIMWEMASLFEHIGTVQDGMKTLNTPHAITDKPNAGTLQVSAGQIDFSHVDFNYGRGDKIDKLFDDFNLHIKAGEKVGLVGRSGAGKSTLVNLLLRFYDVDGGQVRIDGQDISAVTQNSLRAQIGMVTQDTALLHRTVRENIAYGKPDATDDEIIAAAKLAHAWDFIQTLQDKHGNTGLDTQVGERGVKLSGGQRQRIAIARVMLKNAPILLLDEATSALDSEVEFAITQSLDDMMAGKTVIAIAHRLSTIASLDKLVVMDKGRIIEMGSHDELIAQGGVYANLWARQSGGFLGEMDGEMHE
ncbi:multidrug ABC transporter ATP-binding protein [Moraxella caviae]|uniref:Multidrug ABC transporter ATP-binding protein n=1 Tax=Moraxella caviae TaxID=34060 RepID=A0A1S9ZXH9_9GAMM|nr:ABC transporter ATP-binding protein [Moraxella caviae]OOR88153.1 multidrug ABC transporter ATP-binding protein [Moraxella caviae]STZ10505.1 Putative multidrug export ATP-binding/permease protein SAV1866 [Moraxella caviae]VEW12526.1 Putative multidrug export ATP-binding/permease protein SAV1866 [Moraxella caviae]VEW13099.1 Putative multidrug export ATP-binding/permease protein SAV1866 [Moraxella caviae]